MNLKEQDAFHLTIEEYLLALISMVEELVSHPLPGYWSAIGMLFLLIEDVTGPPGCQLGHSR